MNEKNYEELKKASFRNALLSILGFIIIIGSLIFSYFQLAPLETEVAKKTELLRERETKLKLLQQSIKKYKKEFVQVEKEINVLKESRDSLKTTQDSLLDFITSVAGSENIRILDSSIDWSKFKKAITELPAGSRKNAILNAMLLAWKDLPFNMGQEGLLSGFDSPRFLRYVLRTVDIDIRTKTGERLSDSLMKFFEPTSNPNAGDLVFYKGDVGSFGFILAYVGENHDEHVGIGTLQKNFPLGIYSMGNINTRKYPLKGYFRVPYPDE